MLCRTILVLNSLSLLVIQVLAKNFEYDGSAKEIGYGHGRDEKGLPAMSRIGTQRQSPYSLGFVKAHQMSTETSNWKQETLRSKSGQGSHDTGQFPLLKHNYKKKFNRRSHVSNGETGSYKSNGIYSKILAMLFGKPTLSDKTSEMTKAEPRLFIMTTVGVINGLIASGAALSMGGVVLVGILVMVKMVILGMLLTTGWIYIM